MSQRFVVQAGEPVLRQKCSEVKSFNAELWSLLDDMKQTVRAEQGAACRAADRRIPACCCYRRGGGLF